MEVSQSHKMQALKRRFGSETSATTIIIRCVVCETYLPQLLFIVLVVKFSMELFVLVVVLVTLVILFSKKCINFCSLETLRTATEPENVPVKEDSKEHIVNDDIKAMTMLCFLCK